MHIKIRSLVYDHGQAVLAFLLILGLLTLPLLGQSSKERQTITPSTVIIDQATTVDQGVEISWLESQPGTYKIRGYLIERSRSISDFKQIGRVEKGSTNFLDPEGRIGDTYRVIAIDNQKPRNRSPAGEPVSATPAPPGSVVIVRPTKPEVLGATDPLKQNSQAPKRLEHLFKEFKQAAKKDDETYARNLLDLLQDHHYQILNGWASFSGSQKAKLAKVCKKHSGSFESSSHLLPEDYHLDSMLVKSGCDAIKDLAK